MFKFFDKFFTKAPDNDERRKNRRKVLDSWSSDMLRSHPCPLCLKKSTWWGKLCDNCQVKLDIWCPCDADTTYWDEHNQKSYTPPKRAPLPDWLCDEHCNRCGMRIKSIWLLMEETDSTANDDAIQKLVEQYETLARKNNDDFRSK